jgi:nitrite reductase/ring-hydroxylating ferredoxin subunit
MGKVFENRRKPAREGRKITVGQVEAVPAGRGATVKLKDGKEIALFNVGGNFYATENFCPHKGYALADSRLYGSIVECDLHGWRFDVRNGECFTKPSCPIESYEVVIEDGWIKILV